MGIDDSVFVFLIILGIPVYFLWRWVFKKANKLDKLTTPTKIATWIATVISTPVLYVAIVLLFFSVSEYYPNNNFDKKAWLTNKDERYEYSSNLIDSKILINKTKAEVRQLLGDDGNLDSSDDWYYDLGYRPEIGNIDPDSLEIEFKNGKVINVKQNKH